MAASQKPTNRFGIVDTSIFDLVRNEQRRKQREQLLLNTESGVNRGSAAVGLAIGDLLRRGAKKAGFFEDAEREEAEQVDAAQKRAAAAVKAIPDELKATDPFGAGIQERRELIAELTASGLTEQADVVRQQVISLQDQKAKFDKLQGERRLQEIQISTEEAELEALNNGLREKDEVTRLIAKQNTLDLTDSRQAVEFDILADRISKLTTITGTTEFDVPFDEVTVRALDKDLAATVGALDGFLQAKAEFDPKFLELGTKVKNFAVKAADIAGLDLPEDVKQEFRDYMVFRQVTSTNLNAYIKAITGAQMSNPEAIRLANDVPTLDDSPEQYIAKLESVTQRLTAVRERSLQALAASEDPAEFRRIRSTPLSEFMPKARNAEQSDEASRARDALGRLGSILAGQQEG